jgi:zinc transport system ATP-binding protein
MQITTYNICIEIKDVSFNYNGISILNNINFSVKEGEYLGIIGPNGGGKTTLLKIILGLLKPTSGEVLIFGKNIYSFKEHYLMGYVPQRTAQAGLHFPATVEEIVKTGRTAKVGLFKRFSEEDLEEIQKAMEIADVTGYKDRLLSHLSGGQRQRVFIARALAGDPKILILDEPTTGIDISSQEKFYTFLRDLNRKLGLTIIVVSHDMSMVVDEAKSVLCLNREMVCHGSPKDFMKEEFLEKLYGKKVKFVVHRH